MQYRLLYTEGASSCSKDSRAAGCHVLIMQNKGGRALKKRKKAFMACGWLSAVCSFLFFIALSFSAKWFEQRPSYPETRGDPLKRLAMENRLLTVEGRTYTLRSDLTTILLMGIDRDRNTVQQGFRNGGQADFLRLLVIDRENCTIQQIQIDRDTMTPITVLGVTGNAAGERTAQICLSHGFGDGAEQSCELTSQAVSRLLCDIPVDLYLAMNMDGISVLNDALGGITVTVSDDFSALDAAMRPGVTLTLQGKQAEYYVRRRMDIGEGTNRARMLRQEIYLAQVSERILTRMMTDKENIGVLYDTLQPYLTTNISRGRLINEAWNAREYRRMDTLRISGEYIAGQDGFVEFHADQAALQQLVTDIFYEEVK